MDSFSISSVIENNVNNKPLLRRKARQPNPVIYRKLRRGSAVAKIPGKQIETYKQPDKVLPYNNNKAFVNDEDEEWLTQSDEERQFVIHDDKGKQEHEISIQKSNNYSPKRRKKKNSHINRANKECCISRSPSHVIYVKDTIETIDCHQEKLQRSASSNCEAFIRFCSTEIICPQEDRAALAVKLYGVQAALLSGLGNPFENISQSMSSSNSSSSQVPAVLTLSQASTVFLPAMLWTGMFTVSFFYTVMVVWSLPFRVPIISMLCISFLYCLSLLVAAASGFSVMCGTFRMHGILFASLGVLSFVLLLLVLVMLVLFASWWRRINQDGAKR